MSTPTPQEKLIQLQTKLHSDWLKHPVTVDFAKVIQARLEKKKKELQDAVLVSTDEKRDIQYRSTLSTLTTVIQLFGDTKTFIEELNKLTPNT